MAETTLRSSVGVPLAAVRAGHQQLISALAGLTDADARRVSALPGWSRGHVLTHLSHHAQAFTRQTREAQAGRQVEVYDGGRAGRDAAIEAGAGRSAQALRDEVIAACEELDQLWAELAPAEWDLRCGYRDGTLVDGLLSRWREVDIHLVDLVLGATSADWSVDLCEHLLDYLTPRVPAGLPLALHATDAGRTWTYGAGAGAGSDRVLEISGRLVDLTAWLAGRTPSRPLESTSDSLPALDPWP